MKKKKDNIKNIKSSLFEIKENNDLINSLYLNQYKFKLLDNTDIIQTVKDEKNISENNNNTYIEIKDKENNKNNNSNDNSSNNEHDNDIMLNINIEKIKQENKIKK